MNARTHCHVDTPDRLVFGLTSRDLAALAVGAVPVLAVYLAIREMAEPAQAAILIPLGALVLIAALVRFEGAPIEEVAIAGFRYLVSSKSRGGSRGTREGWPVASPSLPCAFDLDGPVELGADGVAIAVRASAVNLELRSEPERRMLVRCFARLLDSLDGSIQIVVVSRRPEVGSRSGIVRDCEAGKAPPALEACHLDYRRLLAGMLCEKGTFNKVISICLREPGGDHDVSRQRLSRRVGQMATVAGVLGLRSPASRDAA